MELSTQTIIDGYSVTIDDGNCYVERASGGCSASLAALESTGMLMNGDRGHRVVRPTINKIVEWAAQNGGPADVG